MDLSRWLAHFEEIISDFRLDYSPVDSLAGRIIGKGVDSGVGRGRYHKRLNPTPELATGLAFEEREQLDDWRIPQQRKGEYLLINSEHQEKKNEKLENAQAFEPPQCFLLRMFCFGV